MGLMFRSATIAVILATLMYAPAYSQDEDLSHREYDIQAAWKTHYAELEVEPGASIDIPPFAGPVPQEALDRRARSIERLEAKGVPVADSLPVIETVQQSRRLTTEQVAHRALGLVIVAVRGETQDDKLTVDLLEEFDAHAYLTPSELEYIGNPNTEENEHLQFVWRYEALNALLWALGFHDELAYPNEIVDVKWVADLFLENGAEGFLARAKLRDQAEILDEADLIYRYHWATREAENANTEMPAGLEWGVVLERHYALNWLVGYLDQEWDEVTTDT